MVYPIIGVIVFATVAILVATVGDHIARGINEFFDESP
jgi:hypothetical protein